MKINSYRRIGFALVAALYATGQAGIAVAQEATPTAVPTSTAIPAGVICPTVQSCVTEQVPAVLQSCLAADPACTLRQPYRFALTAADLATRAIEARKCTDPIFLQSKIQCNACYRAAKRPLSVRAAGALFRGLIGQSVRIVEQKRKEVCSPLTNTLPRGTRR